MGSRQSASEKGMLGVQGSVSTKKANNQVMRMAVQYQLAMPHDRGPENGKKRSYHITYAGTDARNIALTVQGTK